MSDAEMETQNTDSPLPPEVTVEPEPPKPSLVDNINEISDDILGKPEHEVIDFQYFHWEITDYNGLAKRIQGPTFQAAGHAWRLLLFPRGNIDASPDAEGFLSVYLEMVDVSEDSYCCARFAIIISPLLEPDHYIEHKSDWGFTRFAKLDALLKSYIKDNALRLTVVVRAVKDETGVMWLNTDRHDYNSKKVTSFTGIKNQGTTCYLNSMFQALYCAGIFRKTVYQTSTENDSSKSSKVLALQKLFYNLQHSSDPVDSSELLASLGWSEQDAFMQHDIQEFNIKLLESLDAKMKGTSNDGAIKKLFYGKTKSCIQCINVNYQSEKVEEYSDLQLVVSGCKNLDDSFKQFIAEETLDDKYHTDDFGPQEATKRLVFESFPPILFMQLKRFEFDMKTYQPIKIQDYLEFPTKIDLEPYLSDSADKSEPHIYVLHGVLIHVGANMNSGHYSAFLKPNQEGKWLKFDDEKVIPVTQKEVFDKGYGGSDSRTSAYMLVYYRESRLDSIITEVKEEDIPRHLSTRIIEERVAKERERKRKEEERMYAKVYVVNDESFLSNRGFDFVDFNEKLSTVHIMRFKRTDEIASVREQIGKTLSLAPGSFRLWSLTSRENKTIRPDVPLGPSSDFATVEDERQKNNPPELRLYVELASSPDEPFPEPLPSMIFVFIKYFDVDQQELRGIGKLYAMKHDRVRSIESKVKAMAGLNDDTDISLYEEIKHNDLRVDKISSLSTFIDAEIQNGDLICIQRKLSLEEEDTMRANGLFPTIPEFMGDLHKKLLKKRRVSVTICEPTLKDEYTVDVRVSEYSKASKLIEAVEDARLSPENELNSPAQLRIFDVNEHKFVREIASTDEMKSVFAHAKRLYAERILEDEHMMSEDSYFISVFHYHGEPQNTHSVPFKFMVKKDEDLSDSKLRLQQRTGMTDFEMSRTSLRVFPQEGAELDLPTDQDKSIKLSDYVSAGGMIGMNHEDTSRRPGWNGGIFIRE